MAHSDGKDLKVQPLDYYRISGSSPIPKDVDVYTLVKGIVGPLYYTNGNDNRMEKGGSADVMIESVVGSHISTLGIWPRLPEPIRLKIRHSKKYPFDLNDTQLRIVYSVLAANANTYSKRHYCCISSKHLAIIVDAISNPQNAADSKERHVVTGFRSMFLDQERQKCDGNLRK